MNPDRIASLYQFLEFVREQGIHSDIVSVRDFTLLAPHDALAFLPFGRAPCCMYVVQLVDIVIDGP